MAITTIIFDCFGVLYYGDRGYALDLAHDSKRDRVNELFNQADYGYITADEFMQQVTELLEIEPDELTRRLNNQYLPNTKLMNLLPELRARGYKTGMLSNVNDSLIGQLFTAAQLEEYFDDIVTSSSVGLVKPSHAIYELAAKRLEVTPEEAIFIDDIERNATAATEVGMHGITYTTYDTLIRDFKEKGIHA